MKSLMSILLFSLFVNSAFANYENIKTYTDHVQQLKHIDVNGMDMAYIDEGEVTSKPIVLMHGIPTNSWMYRKLIPKLVAKGYRVIVPDLLGMGQSEKTKDESLLHVKSQAKFILDLLTDKLALIEWTHLVHDFGGAITWEMMEDARFQINKLVILDTFAFKNGWKPGLNILTKGFMSLMTTKPLMKSFYTMALKSMVNDKSTASPNMLNGYVDPLTNGASFTYKCLYFSANKLKKELPRYQRNISLVAASGIPVKIIWGKHDKFLSSSSQLNQFKELLGVSDSDVLILDKAKHLIAEEAPAQIVLQITK